ncbi:YihY/virulence factor BrkB family protein [Erythrobacter aureus]|uniref:YihY/virulence factor BrkB family protein n=1 Tax=Erythrobacter aureus TaxID=2182384 RepID=UPI003A8DEDC6
MLSELKRAWQAGSQDNIGIVAAGIAHYALLALVPALGAVVLAYGVFATPETVAGHIELLAAKLPASAADLIAGQLEAVSGSSSSIQGLGLLASLAVALFGARSGAKSLMTGLNLVFRADRQRSFVRSNLVAIGITAAGLAGLILAGVASAALANLEGAAARLASMLLFGGVGTLAAGLLYRFAPNTVAPPWPAIWPGAILFAVLWIAATIGFAFYAANFGSYNATYGALGAVLALITWFWATGFLLLLGAEVTALRSGQNPS